MPHRLGRYAVRRRIGSGGFATVWLAYDEQLDSPVAIKVLADNWTEDHHVRQRFLEEGRYLRKVESPHVVSVYDAGELEDGRPYLVMSYADQGTLADRLEIEGLTSAQAMEVIRQIGAGLQALHDRDILHRDVKPANVLFRSVGSAGRDGNQDVRAMVGDLGLGKALDMSSRLTMVAGTPSFVAPEQAQAENPDARADQYSLACLAFLLLAGRAPYSHASLSAAANPGPPPPLSSPERPYADAVQAVVHRGLALDREDRYPTVTAFVAALADALDEHGGSSLAKTWLPIDPDLTRPAPRPSPRPEDGPLPEPTPPSGSGRRRGRRGLRVLAGLAAVVVALAVGAGVGYALQQQSVPTEDTLSDASGTLEVTVPTTWDHAVSRDGWTPPESDTSEVALSVGTAADWNTRGGGQGVFLGLLPGTRLPPDMPGHPECESSSQADRSDSSTVVHAGCPGGVVVERVVQVTDNLLLWVQVRSDDRATANRVLDSVRTSGL